MLTATNRFGATATDKSQSGGIWTGGFTQSQPKLYPGASGMSPQPPINVPQLEPGTGTTIGPVRSAAEIPTEVIGPVQSPAATSPTITTVATGTNPETGQAYPPPVVSMPPKKVWPWVVGGVALAALGAWALNR